MFINETQKAIEMSAVEYKAAMTYGTEEYKALREIRNDYPGFKPVEVKVKKTKTALDKLDMRAIKAYVKANGSHEQKAEFLCISTPHITDEGAYIAAESFFEIKKWFLAQFPEYKAALENHEAEILRIFDAVDAKIAEAQAKAAKQKREKAETEAADFLAAS